MRMRVVPYVLAALLGGAAAALVACGSGGERRQLIPVRSADRLKSALSDVRQAVDDGDCDEAQRAIARARGVLVTLPPSVSDRLVTRLQQGIDNLQKIAPHECVQQATQTQTVPTTEQTTPQTTETTPETTTEPTTPEDTTQTGTTPTTSTSTAPPDTTTTPPVDTTGGANTP